MTTINKDVAKRGIFSQEFKSIVETKNIVAEVATMIVSTAKNIQSPYTSVTAAKAHTAPGRTPVGTLTVAKNELVLDRKIGNTILDTEEELSYAKFDVIGMIRADLYASVLKKLNSTIVTDFVADATVVAGTVDLSTKEKVQEWLVGIAADNDSSAVGLRSKIDGGTVKRCPKHGKAFVLAGRTAYVKIAASVAAIVGQSSLKGIEGKMIQTPYGVTVINLADAADNTNRLIYGTAGAPTVAYREDMIDVDMGQYVNTVTHSGADDIDITAGDNLLEKTWYMKAETKGKNGIFSDVQSLVSTQLMA